MMELELKRFERISSELDRFRIRGKLTDLIFVCRENDLSLGFVPAHQAMFSSISSLLNELFKVALEKQPYEKVMIILDSVDCIIMEKLIEYIYKGETKVNYQERQELFHLSRLLHLNIPLSEINTSVCHTLPTILSVTTNNDLRPHWILENEELSTLPKVEYQIDTTSDNSYEITQTTTVQRSHQITEDVMEDNDVEMPDEIEISLHQPNDKAEESLPSKIISKSQANELKSCTVLIEKIDIEPKLKVDSKIQTPTEKHCESKDANPKSILTKTYLKSYDNYCKRSNNDKIKITNKKKSVCEPIARSLPTRNEFPHNRLCSINPKKRKHALIFQHNQKYRIEPPCYYQIGDTAILLQKITDGRTTGRKANADLKSNKLGEKYNISGQQKILKSNPAPTAALIKHPAMPQHNLSQNNHSNRPSRKSFNQLLLALKSPCSIDERKKILALLKFRVAKW